MRGRVQAAGDHNLDPSSFFGRLSPGRCSGTAQQSGLEKKKNKNKKKKWAHQGLRREVQSSLGLLEVALEGVLMGERIRRDRGTRDRAVRVSTA
jgi:hypothetical protein